MSFYLPRTIALAIQQIERWCAVGEKNRLSLIYEERGLGWDSIPRKTVTAAPRKMEFWLESKRPPFMLDIRSEFVAWAFDCSIETEIYTLQRFDLLFFRGYFWWDERLNNFPLLFYRSNFSKVLFFVSFKNC